MGSQSDMCIHDDKVVQCMIYIIDSGDCQNSINRYEIGPPLFYQCIDPGNQKGLKDMACCKGLAGGRCCKGWPVEIISPYTHEHNPGDNLANCFLIYVFHFVFFFFPIF